MHIKENVLAGCYCIGPHGIGRDGSAKKANAELRPDPKHIEIRALTSN